MNNSKEQQEKSKLQKAKKEAAAEKRRQKLQLKFRLPHGSTFHAVFDEKECLWSGELHIHGEEPKSAQHQSLHYLLKKLGHKWAALNNLRAAPTVAVHQSAVGAPGGQTA